MATSIYATTVQPGESIASEGKGDYLYVEGRVLTTDGKPIPGAIIETWEADGNGKYQRIFPLVFSYNVPPIGFYDTQYKDRSVDCRGRLRTDKDGKYGYRAVVPIAYPVPGDVRS
jgi:protocatechuate 3,4-dioxygenase beta subunit